MLEELGSASIEGNRTTIAGATIPFGTDERIKEYLNVELALDLLETIPPDSLATAAVCRELHRRIVAGPSAGQRGEGSSNPGEWRVGLANITGSRLRPSAAGDVPALMQELFSFLARLDDPRYDLIKLALAHHRFAWIHPFDNGNGRTVRLFTYGLLVRAGFRVAGIGQNGRILQPTAIFCSDRAAYYAALDRADDGLLAWCLYVLRGLKLEIEKIDRLSDYNFLRDHLLLPSINELAERGSDRQFRCLSVLRRKTVGYPYVVFHRGSS